MTMLNPCDLEIVTGGVLDNDYIDYLTILCKKGR